MDRCRTSTATSTQTQEGNEDILFGVLVREKGFPAAVGDIVSPDEFDLVRSDFVLDLVHADLARADVSTGRAKVLHPGEGQLAQVAILDACADEWHRYVSLNAIDACPGRNEREDACDQVDERVGRVVLVPACPPEFVQTRAADHEGRVDFEPVGAKGRVFKVFPELVEISLEIDVWQIWHHVADDLESGVFGEFEGLRYGCYRMAAVRVTSDVFVQRLDANLEPCAAVAEHCAEMRFEAVIRSSFNRDSNALDIAHLARLDCFVDLVGLIPAQGVV